MVKFFGFPVAKDVTTFTIGLAIFGKLAEMNIFMTVGAHLIFPVKLLFWFFFITISKMTRSAA